MTALMLFTIAWVVGILISQATSIPMPFVFLLCPAALVLYVGWGDERWSRRGAAMLVALVLGSGRLVLAQPRINDGHVAFYNDLGGVSLEGVIDGELEKRSNLIRARMKTSRIIFTSGEKLDVRGDVLVTLPPFGNVRYGDRIVVGGNLETPPIFETFSYKEYLAHQGIHAVFIAESYTILDSHQACLLKDLLLQLKDYAHQIILRLYAEPQAALLSGILLGIESGLPEPLENAFNLTGTGHIVAISGFNLSIIAGGFAALTSRLFKKKGRTWVALIGVWLYVMLVGASASVSRAGVMATLGIIAVHEQRKVHGPTALAAAVFVLTLLNPYALWDVGFQLSFAATLGMVLYVKPLEKRLATGFERWLQPEQAARLVGWLSESVLVTVAAQFVTIGVIVGTFHRLSLVSLVTNILILPVQFYIMLFGGLSLLIGLVFTPLAQPVAWIAWLFLKYTTVVVNAFARVPWASIELGTITLPVICAYYAVLFSITGLLRSTKDERMAFTNWLKTLNPAFIVAGIAVIFLIVIAGSSVPDGKLHITFLDVGAGDAVFIRTPQGRQILVDGGKDSTRTLAQLGKHMPFWDRSLDMVILTSPDTERLGGLVAVLDRYTVTNIISGGETASGNLYDEWQRLLNKRENMGTEAPAFITKAGDIWILDKDVILDILWPAENAEGPLVMQISYGSIRALMPGDATTLIEEELVARYGEGLHSTILLVPRHGASTAAIPRFLQAVDPEVTVAAGQNPVSPYVLARLAGVPLYTTAEHGSVMLKSNGKTLQVQTERN